MAYFDDFQAILAKMIAFDCAIRYKASMMAAKTIGTRP